MLTCGSFGPCRLESRSQAPDDVRTTVTLLSTPAAPTSDIDPFDLAVLADPYPAHRTLRDAGPAVRLQRHDVWAFARFEQVWAALQDPGTYSSASGVGLSDFRRETPWRPLSLLLEADPPEHTRARAVMTRVLSPAAIRSLRVLFTERADALVADLVRRETFDGITDLAQAFPLSVFSDAVGLPTEATEYLLPYGSMVFNSYGPRNDLAAESMRDVELVRARIDAYCAREALHPDGLGAAIHDASAADGLSTAEAGLLVRSVLSAGVDTTVHGLGNALMCLLDNPDQWDVLHEDPARSRAAFEESVRLESPVQTFFRTLTADVSIEGLEIPAGDRVLLFFGAANRDPRQWPDPDRFDVRRQPSGHLGFGTGIHACVGQMLARLEGEVLLDALARQVRSMRPAGAPVRLLNNTLRGLRSLPMSVVPATR